MELVEGLPLSVLLRCSAALGRPLPLEAVVELGVSLCSALHYAHTRRGPDGELLGVVHRDVSPHNVLVSKGGVVKLIDFGIARAKTREVHTKTGQMRGKLAYAAPEQITAGPVDARSDVFSLGVLLYEATTLTRPFLGDSEPAIISAILEGRRRKIGELRPEAGELATAIERAMKPDREARWPNAEAFAAALEAGLGKTRPGPAVLAELVSFVETHRDALPNVPSLPPPPMSGSPPISGSDTLETAVDPALAKLRDRSA
jgi:serine/threonine-protein kinase